MTRYQLQLPPQGEPSDDGELLFTVVNGQLTLVQTIEAPRFTPRPTLVVNNSDRPATHGQRWAA